MRSKHYISVIVAAAMLLPGMTSCLEVNEPVQTGREVKLEASLIPGNIFTKAGIGSLDPKFNQELTIGMARIDENLTAGYPTFKNAGNQLEALMKPGNPDINTRSISFVKDYQQFEDATSKIKYASWYPFDPNSYDKANAQVKTPIDGNTDIMYGDIATGDQKNGFNTIYFNHALSKFTFHVYAMVQENADPENLSRVWGKLKDIKIKGLATDCIIDLPINSYKPNTYKISYTGAKKENIMSVPHETDASGQVKDVLLNEIPVGGSNAALMPALLAAPPADGLLNVLVETENQGVGHQVATKTLTIARDFKPGRNYDIYLRFSDHGLINTEVIIGEWHQHPGDINANSNNKTYYDLSATEHANCYVVTSANYSYCFDVTTIGNGDYGIINGTTTKIKPGYIDLIWVDSSLKDHFHLENNYPIQNRALFNITNTSTDTDPENKTLSHEGNALIGAWSDNPANGGQLLWTWHIWVTDFPKDQAYKNGFVALDRDLGAIDSHVGSATAAKNLDGLYYQWGRPTPLPLGRQAQKKDGTAFVVQNDANDVHLMSRISNPDKFYTMGETMKAMPEYENLWGYEPEYREYRKTIYDPCPVGYRMPSKSLFLHIKYTGFTLNKEHGHSFESKVDTYYLMSNPLSGYWADQTTATNYDKGSYLWTSSLEKGKTIGLSAVKNENEVPQLSQQEEHALTDALPVRCVSKRSVPEIKDLSAYQTANSYIVDQTGYYKFKANIRGNGVNELVSSGQNTTIDITENVRPDISNKAYRVVPLWWQGDLSVDGANDLDPNNRPIPVKLLEGGLLDEKGYVSFYLRNKKRGNLIVAVLDQPGNILWSWHLWLTDTPTIHDSYDFAVMDRFLGAPQPSKDAAGMTPKDATASIGLFYQWGRKDPFPGPASITGQNFSSWWKYDWKTDQWTKKTGLEATTNAPAEKTVANSVTAPTRYHLSQNNLFNGGNIPVSGFWVSDQDNAMENQCFSNTAHQDAMWGYSSSEGLGKTTTKTMYDPCPPGYSVAYYLLWTNATTGNDAPIYSYKDAGDVNATSITQSNTYGIYLTHTGYSGTWYPYTGYIDSYDGSLKQVGAVGRFHSSTPAGNGSRSLYYRNNGGILTGQAIDTSNGKYWGIPSSYAYPIRCQKD